MCRFIKSATDASGWIDDDCNEFCFIGRSNVGKSSLINSMAKKKIAISSKTPGRTQLINFYSFKHFRIIDLPGYGYAKVSKDKHNELMAYIDLYISSRKNIFGVFQVCDIGVVTNDDKQASQYIQKKFINHFVVLNKIDKIPKTLLKKRINEIAKFLSIDEKKIILTSTKKNLGINDIYKKIHECAKI